MENDLKKAFTYKTDNGFNVYVTESCFRRIAFVCKQENKPSSMLKLGVEGGGCSGFQYKFSFAESQDKDDFVMEHGKAKVLVDPVSLEFLRDSTIDFKDEILETCFFVNNPNAKSSCGCGLSFSYDLSALSL